MSYGLRGWDGRVYGLGVFNAPARPDWVDPGYPPDPAIVARNTAENSAYQVAVQMEQAGNNFDQCAANAQNANSPEQYAEVMARCNQQAEIQSAPMNPVVTYDTPPVAVTPRPNAPARGGQLSFTSSRGGTALQVGDTWLVAITGATPNSPVTVSGSGNTGTFGATSMGSTDSNGNYSKSGAVGTGELGSWSEQWAVGGVPSGSSVSFSVSNALAPKFEHTLPLLVTPGGGAVLTPTGAVVPSSAGFDFAKIPWWAWAGAAGVAVFAFGGRGRGR